MDSKMTNTYWIQWTFDSKVEFFIKLFIGKPTLKLLTHLEKASIYGTDLQWVDMRSFSIHWVIWYPSASNSGCPLIISLKNCIYNKVSGKFWSCEAGSFKAEKWAEARHLSWSRSAPVQILVFSSPTNYMLTSLNFSLLSWDSNGLLDSCEWSDLWVQIPVPSSKLTASRITYCSFRSHTFQLHSFEADNFKTHNWVVRFLQVEWSLSLDPSSLFEAHSFPYLTTPEFTISKVTHGLLDSNL